MKKIFFVALFTILFIGKSFSQSQMELNSISYKKYEKADVKMTLLYKKILKSITSSTKRTLFVESQRAWIKYKEAEAKSQEAIFGDGSMSPMIYSASLSTSTEERIKL